MKLETKQLIEMLGVVAVVLSLIFVAYEIRQSNRIALATAEMEVLNNASALNELRITDDELRSLILKIREGNGSYNPDSNETEMMNAYITRFMNLVLSKEAAYRNGVLSEDSLNRSLDDIRRLTTPVGMRPFFQYFIDSYPSDSENLVISFLDGVLQEYESGN